MTMLGITVVGFFLAVLYLGENIESLFGNDITNFVKSNAPTEVVDTVGEVSIKENSEPTDVLKRLSVVVLAIPFFLLYFALEYSARSWRRRSALDEIRIAMVGLEPSSQPTFPRRFVAFCIDLAVFVGLAIAVLFLAVFVADRLALSLEDSLTFMAILIIVGSTPWLYEAFMLSSKRQATLGKMVFSLAVTDLAGERLSLGRATGRFFAKLLAAIVWLILVSLALIWAGDWPEILVVVVICSILFLVPLFLGKKRAFHEMLAGTQVLYRPQWHKALEAVGAHRR